MGYRAVCRARCCPMAYFEEHHEVTPSICPWFVLIYTSSPSLLREMPKFPARQYSCWSPRRAPVVSPSIQTYILYGSPATFLIITFENNRKLCSSFPSFVSSRIYPFKIGYIITFEEHRHLRSSISSTQFSEHPSRRTIFPSALLHSNLLDRASCIQILQNNPYLDFLDYPLSRQTGIYLQLSRSNLTLSLNHTKIRVGLPTWRRKAAHKALVADRSCQQAKRVAKLPIELQASRPYHGSRASLNRGF